jgi:NAD(P)H-hydrate epimerase
MKIFTAIQVRKADSYTIQHEPIASIDLMERAAEACFHFIDEQYTHSTNFYIYCGPGNNGGDGLAIARMLLQANYQVDTFCFKTEKQSPDYITNFHRLSDQPGNRIHLVENSEEIVNPNESSVIIDAIFGTGINKPIEGIFAEAIEKINSFDARIIAIDTPSGLKCDETSKPPIIKAFRTLTFQFPKRAFMFPSNNDFVGDWKLLDIGLSSEFIENEPTHQYYVDQNMIDKMIKPRGKFSHKGTFGHALIVAGSKGKMGAAVIATRSCVMSGVGLVTTHIPERGEVILQTTNPEAMVSIDDNHDFISQVPLLDGIKAIGIGPGIGKEKQTAEVVKTLMQTAQCPMVIDADALNIISENNGWLELIPSGSILTPHMKEFERLFGPTKDDFDRHQLQIEAAKKYKVVIVLKGAHTCIATPEGEVYFNSTGNSSLARGGSGDMLTGIITANLAQGYPAKEAAILGVYNHGKTVEPTTSDW